VGSLGFISLYFVYVTFVVMQTKWLEEKEKNLTGQEGAYFEMKE